MPLLPYISDTYEVLDKMYAAFCDAGAQYIMPASLTLFGHGPHDSKTLFMRALSKYYPELVNKYKELFNSGFSVPYSYQGNLKKITAELSKKYEMPDRMIRIRAEN